MEENVQSKKIGFFKRLKMAIFKLEDYGMFLGERVSVAFKYFFILVLLASIIISVATTVDFFKMVNKISNYIQNELPEFVYEEGKLHFDNYIEAYDHEYDFGLIINTDDNLTEENLKEYKNKFTTSGIIILNTKAIFISEGNEIEENYETLTNNYGININNKNDLMKFLQKSTVAKLIGTYFIVDCVATYIVNLISVLLDLCIVAVFGWIAAKFCGINFKLAPMFALAIYSLSLSIVLYCVYNVVYIFTRFYIQYFNVIYLLIAYVYIIAAIFMIKYDLIKQTAELQKIIEVQKQVRKEIDEQEEEEPEEENKEEKEDKKEKKDDSKEEKDKGKTDDEPVIESNKEPDGSEI